MASKFFGEIKKKFKGKFVFKLAQIPLIAFFLIVAASELFLFSNSKTAHYEATASEISKVAKVSTNNQLTADFYPNLTLDQKTYDYLGKLIGDTNSFNRKNYIYYRGNGHKVRVVANGEGRADYRFPELPTNPTMILENTFSVEWGKEHLYENLSINLMNKTNVYNATRTKHLFLNETDALYLIENNSRFAGKTLEEIPGETLTMKYKKNNGIEFEEEWTIANIVMANQLDDKLYKKLYTSYVVADFHIPITDMDNCYCVAFDFATSDVDNAKFLTQIVPRYADHKLRFDTRNLTKDKSVSLEKIKNEFFKLANYKTSTDNRLLIVSLAIIIVFTVLVYFWCSTENVPVFSTCVLIGGLSALLYIAFHLISLFMTISIVTRAFNTYSIISFLLLTLYAMIVVAITSHPSKKKATNNNKKKSNGEVSTK